MKKVLFVTLEPYADWEGAYMADALRIFAPGSHEVKTVSLTKAPLRSMGGFTIIPDYDVASVPEDYAAVVLLGGMSWRTEKAQAFVPLIEDCLNKRRVLGGICDGAGFLAGLGFLDNVHHTINDIGDVKRWVGKNYEGEPLYENVQVVRDGNIVTANGTAAIEFAREMLFALGIGPENKIKEWFRFHKFGIHEDPGYEECEHHHHED